MPLSLSKHQLELMAAELLPMMDDPRAFDEPIPDCVHEGVHDWRIVHDKEVEGKSLASWSITYPVAIVCTHCDRLVGLG